ncbi:MAG: hypothetical protein Q8P67_10110 [archaeon]|nr:hypothetical protein [archaeon]
MARFFNVAVHELCHTFMLDHCAYELQCLMNSVDPLPEMLDGSLPLCPQCLAKLRHLFSFDVDTRYRHLSDFFSQEAALFPLEARWYSLLISTLTSSSPSSSSSSSSSFPSSSSSSSSTAAAAALIILDSDSD